MKICHAGGRREGGDKLQFNVFSGTDNKLVAQVVQKRGELVTSRMVETLEQVYPRYSNFQNFSRPYF